MADIQQKIVITQEGDGAAKAKEELKKVEEAGAQASTSLAKIKDASKQADTQMTSLGSAAKGLWTSLGLLASGALAASILTSAKSAEAMAIGLKNVSGNDLQANLQVLSTEVNGLGLNLESSTRAFVGLTAAARGTSLQGTATRDIFKAVSEASTALHLSASDTEGALKAIQQMMSKGTVQAEELRGQLGERLPGAFNIAARSMGVTTEALGKMLEAGTVVSADFLPKFAAQLHQEFGKQAAESAHSLTAELNRLNTAWFSLKASIGGSVSGPLKELAKGLVSVTDFVRENMDSILALAESVGVAVVAFKGWQLAMSSGITASAAFGAALTAAFSSPLVAIASVTLSLQALIRFIQMAKADAEELKSGANLDASLDDQRAGLEKEIEQMVASQKLSREMGDALKQSMAMKFAPTATTEAFGDGMVAQEVSTPASREDRFDSVKRVRNELHPELSAKPSTAAVRPVDNLKEQIEAIQRLTKLREQLTEATATGLEKELVTAQISYEARQREIAQLSLTAHLDADETEQLNKMNEAVRSTAISEAKRRDAAKAEAGWHKKEAEEARQATEAMRGFEEGLTQAALGSSETRTERVAREFAARIALYDDLERRGIITEIKMGELEAQARAKRAQALASAAGEGRNDAQALSAQATGGSWAAHTVEINREYKIRRDNLDAYYAHELELAQGNAEKTKAIEEDKTRVMAELHSQQSLASSQIWSQLNTIGLQAEQNFASGMATAFVNIADGSQKAGAALRTFLADFLKMAAQMIMQMLILIALKKALRFFGGASAGSAGSTDLNVGANVGSLAKDGGQFTALAEGGLAGAASVDRPTVFPRFNVLAGEAGREVMTVLARPQAMRIAGMQAIVGNAGPNRLALMSADDLMALTGPSTPKAFANGGMVGGSIPSASGSRAGMAGGAVVEVRLSPGLEARITQNSIQGAVIQVASDMTRDTPIRRATQSTLS